MIHKALVSEAVFDVENSFSFLLDAWNTSCEPDLYSIVIRAHSVADMVRKLLAKIQGREEYYNSIIIQGHGSPGNQSVGDGSGYDSTGGKNLSINWTDDLVGEPTTLVGRAESKLALLVPKLTADCIVTLGGCNVGAGAGGACLMKIISRALKGRLVQAADALQTDLVPGMEGNVIRCDSVKCWQVEKSSWFDVPGW